MLAYLCLSKVIRRTRTTCPPYWLLNKLIVDELHGTMSRCVAHLVSDKFLCIRRILLYFHMSVCLLMFWGWLRVSGDRPQLFFTGFFCVCGCVCVWSALLWLLKSFQGVLLRKEVVIAISASSVRTCPLFPFWGQATLTLETANWWIKEWRSSDPSPNAPTTTP